MKEPINNFANSTTAAYLAYHSFHPMFLANYIIGEELGSGGFGFVVSARERKTGIERAVKFIFRDKVPPHSWVRDRGLGQLIPMEIYILKNIRHSNIIGYVDFYQDPTFCYLVMELHGTQWSTTNTTTISRSPALSETSSCNSSVVLDSPVNEDIPFFDENPRVIKRRTSCDLFECIERHNYFEEPIAKMVFKQIISCIAYLDLLGVCHRDIKDENIVIDDQFQVKLIDFGSAVLLPHHFGERNKSYSFTQFFGTVNFASPEILMNKPYRAEPAEIWSLGVLLYTILFGEVPFHDSNMAIAGQFVQPKIKVTLECYSLISWMLTRSPEQRPTIHQVLMHPWFKQL
ncbi:kinase-like domain-containing protein [Cokeromyces recurvatus]|uniref:kinase-like domain-containing protein n=1 Tax=Cokeromyces recurvatus TaxID=90255 RepID=UPI00221FBCD0|nr:kinase-like domain-containing protein [Cokeromyces recurvatus]KAI7899991.1 kinase-like domain-containing protein [Cokeromyces recurvatus]